MATESHFSTQVHDGEALQRVFFRIERPDGRNQPDIGAGGNPARRLCRWFPPFQGRNSPNAERHIPVEGAVPEEIVLFVIILDVGAAIEERTIIVPVDWIRGHHLTV